MNIRSRLVAEFLGTAGLLIVIAGSGIMGETLASGNAAIALLANSIATGAGLYALIQIFGEISGAHFNPAVSFIEMLWKRLTKREFVLYSFVQVIGGIVGVWVAHIMFGERIFQLSAHDRGDFRFFISEIIATFGLIIVIGLSGKKDVSAKPLTIALYIVAAYWCTSSTSFANPAVTIARSLTNTFSGIHWHAVPTFIFAQILGTVLGYIYCLHRQ